MRSSFPPSERIKLSRRTVLHDERDPIGDEDAGMTMPRLAAPPGPRGFDVLRFFGGGSFANTLAYFREVAERYGPIASFAILGRRMHLVTAPELVKDVLVLQQHRFTRANGAVILRDLLGASMLTVDEPRHREQRRRIQPAFHGRRIAAYGESMIDETLRAIAGWPDRGRIDMSSAMLRLALAIVGRALFGADLRGSADALEATLARAMRVVSQMGPVLEVVPPWANALRLALPLRANAELARARAEMAAVVDGLIAARRADGGEGADLLSLLLAARDTRGDGLDTQTIADELVTMLLAGHETTANALGWAWYALGRDRRLAAAVEAEVAGVAGERELRAADVDALRLTAAVFAEALRLYPPASAFGRRALAPCVLGGYAIGAGDGVILSPYVSGRNPAIFAEPDAFRPERWFDAPPPPFAFFPFGGGSRLCIGEAFARLEGTLVLATIIQHFSFSAPDAEPIGIAAHATLRPARPIVLALQRRSTRTAGYLS